MFLWDVIYYKLLYFVLLFKCFLEKNYIATIGDGPGERTLLTVVELMMDSGIENLLEPGIEVEIGTLECQL